VARLNAKNLERAKAVVRRYPVRRSATIPLPDSCCVSREKPMR